jgi:hypothetical protein
MVYLIERKRLLSYLLYTVIAAAVVLVPTSFVSAATTVGNNVSVGGTLVVTGATTLTGATWASSTFYVGSAAAGEDFVVTNNAVTVGTTVNSSTLAVYGNTTLTGSLLSQTGHNNLYDIGAYSAAFSDVFSSGTVYADTVTVYKVTDTSTIYVSSGAANKGGRIVLEDSDGSGCSVISMANGVLTEATVDCP